MCVSGLQCYVVLPSSVEELVAELWGHREEEQSQEEHDQHDGKQHSAVQPVVPPSHDTHRPHWTQQPWHTGAGTTEQRDLKNKKAIASSNWGICLFSHTQGESNFNKHVVHGFEFISNCQNRQKINSAHIFKRYINTQIHKTGKFSANSNSVIGETQNHKRRLQHKRMTGQAQANSEQRVKNTANNAVWYGDRAGVSRIVPDSFTTRLKCTFIIFPWDYLYIKHYAEDNRGLWFVRVEVEGQSCQHTWPLWSVIRMTHAYWHRSLQFGIKLILILAWLNDICK